MGGVADADEDDVEVELEDEDDDDGAAAEELVGAAPESDAPVAAAESPDPAPVFPVLSAADVALAVAFAAAVAGASG
jgi:hypothetical protein